MEENGNINVQYKAKLSECYVSVKGTVHKLYCQITEEGIFELYLDNKCIVNQKYWIMRLKGIDYAVEIDGETIHCVFDEEKLDVAIHGKYLKSQKNYVPLKVAYIICILLCIVTPINFFMAFSGSMDVAVVILCLVIIVGCRIFYNKALKK